LHGTAKTIRIVRLPGLLEKGDVSDWLDVDARDAGKLADVCFDAPLWTPDTAITEPQHNDDSRLIKSSAEFVAGFVPPDYVVVGLLQRRFLYSNTGQTGAGKTAVTLRLAASTAQGTTFAGRETKKCRVLYAAAENPDDVRMRWIAPRAAYGFDTDTIELYFTEGRFTISKMATQLRAEAEKRGGEFGLVVIDTGPFLRGRR